MGCADAAVFAPDAPGVASCKVKAPSGAPPARRERVEQFRGPASMQMSRTLFDVGSQSDDIDDGNQLQLFDL